MLPVIVGLVVLASIGVGLYSFLKKKELESDLIQYKKLIEERDELIRARNVAHANNMDSLRRELAKESDSLRKELSTLERIKHVPGLIEKAQKFNQDAATALESAIEKADDLVSAAKKDAEDLIRVAKDEAALIAEIAIGKDEEAAKKAKALLSSATDQAHAVVKNAEDEAKDRTARCLKDIKEKKEQIDNLLEHATIYSSEIRLRAETRAEEIAGKAYEATRRFEFYEAAAQAMHNVVKGYGDRYMVPAAHLLDELASEYGFREAGERLRLARDRARIMEKNRTAATCDYAEAMRREFAINFVLDAFNGKVDSILARVKSDNHGKLGQEIRDAFHLVNFNGKAFKDARITVEFLEARLDELKWGALVQQLKDKEREEQRTIKEQIREEEKARRDYERAIKQARRDEELLGRALEKAQQDYDKASEEERSGYEAKLTELAAKLREAEEKNKKALSMAQQTKCGHVYIISNIGSFGEDVFKIGLTRRLDPTDRVRELGDASVPFPFDIHAMIYSEEAPALETKLHRRFLASQVNKANRRKEFFRVDLQEIRKSIEEMGIEAKWTLTAEARAYRETLALERAMNEDPELNRRWLEEQATFDASEVPVEDEELMNEVDAA